MIEKLEVEGRDSFRMNYMKYRVNLDEDTPRPETLISIGEHSYKGKSYPNDVLTAGEFSVISAPSKTRKSFFKSALVACFIGGDTIKYFPNMRSHREGNMGIIDVDTEQSDFYAQRTFRRIPEMTGILYDNYHAFRLRSLSPNERLYFIDDLLKSGKVKNPRLMFIDGVADLIDDTNDLIMSNEVATMLLRWTEVYGIHICVVIHNAYGTSKPTGHLGSAITKKAETVFMLSRDGDEFDSPTKVVHLYSRGMPFEDFRFIIDKDSLPRTPESLEDEKFNDVFNDDYEMPDIDDIPF